LAYSVKDTQYATNCDRLVVENGVGHDHNARRSGDGYIVLNSNVCGAELLTPTKITKHEIADAPYIRCHVKGAGLGLRRPADPPVHSRYTANYRPPALKCAKLLIRLELS